MRIAADTWRGLIFLHRSIRRVKSLDRLHVRILFHQRYESFERFNGGHVYLMPGLDRAAYKSIRSSETDLRSLMLNRPE